MGRIASALSLQRLENHVQERCTGGCRDKIEGFIDAVW